MASMTYDGQSFLLDGRRIWLVSGSVPYSRIPRARWGDTIHAAKQAGLNCVETTIVWSRHEPRHGQFDFQGDNDIREFVKLVHQAGLYCIIRGGPFVDGGHDFGGLPPWLLTVDNLKLRTANQPFLEACSRFITALAGQLRDLQVNAPTPKGTPATTFSGPIVLLQNESGFTCGDDHLAETYLAELDRYWREAGFTVPIINSNDLWQSVEGEIDGWSGYDMLLGHLRQLGTIRPAQPRIVMDFKLGQKAVHGLPAPKPREPRAVVRRLAEVLAAGGQFNIDPFVGGTNFGFAAGRDVSFGNAGFLCASADAGAPVSEVGEFTAMYPAVRRVCTFASRFSRVLSHLDPARQPVALMPESSAPDAESPSRVAVISAVGSQGGVVFVFGDERGRNSAEPMALLLPDGSTLPVDLGDQSVVWCLLETRLSGRANLDYCNICAMALVGKVLICFGPAGTRAMLSINGSPLECIVPEGDGKAPFIQEHEGITVVIASQSQVDQIHFDDNGVFIGVQGLDRAGQPILEDDARGYSHIDPEGKMTSHKALPYPQTKRSTRVGMGEWSFASCADYALGTSPRFAGINTSKPHDLVALGAPYGYGWYRLKFTGRSAGKVKLMFPQAGHRLHLTLDGEPVGLAGVGPGAVSVLPVQIKKGAHTLVILAENAGRVSAGSDLGELTGVYGHFLEVEPIKLSKPKLGPADPLDLLSFRAPLWRMHRDDRSDAVRLTWTLPHRSKNPVLIDIGPFESELAAGTLEREGGLLLLNGKPVHFFQQGGVKPIVLQPEVLLKGNNEVQITLVSGTEAAAGALAKHVHFYDVVDVPSVKADWGFAKWELPPASAYGKGHKHTAGEPCWWKCEFNSGEGDHAILLDLAGLSKGQVYVNGKHLGRYWVGTASAPGGSIKKVAGQSRMVVPRSMLKGDRNELVIFDEHGASSSRVRLIGDPKAGAFDR